MIKLIFRWILFLLWKARILIKMVDELKPNKIRFHRKSKLVNDVDITMDYDIICFHYELHPKIKKLFK